MKQIKKTKFENHFRTRTNLEASRNNYFRRKLSMDLFSPLKFTAFSIKKREKRMEINCQKNWLTKNMKSKFYFHF